MGAISVSLSYPSLPMYSLYLALCVHSLYPVYIFVYIFVYSLYPALCVCTACVPRGYICVQPIPRTVCTYLCIYLCRACTPHCVHICIYLCIFLCVFVPSPSRPRPLSARSGLPSRPRPRPAQGSRARRAPAPGRARVSRCVVRARAVRLRAGGAGERPADQ